MKGFLKKSLAILPLLVILLALSAVPAFADPIAKPTGDPTPVTINEVTSITIRGEDQDIEDAVEAVFEQDNNGPTKFIRTDLDTEYDLQSAEIVINLVSSGTTVSGTGLTFSGGSTTTRTASGVNLLNEKYNVTIGSTTYTLAADTPYGIISVSDSDPLKVADVTFTTSPNVTATVEGMSVNGYAGNPWYEEQQQVQDGVNWVEIKYYVRADDQLPSGTTLSAVPGAMSLATGATPSGCVSGSYPSYTFNLIGPLNTMTVSKAGASRDYHVSAGVEGQVLVYYNIVLDEIEGSQYYTGDVIDQCQEINAAAVEYFDPNGFYVDSGTTVMDILLDFIDWAETNNYFSYDTETGSGYYLSELDGLAAFDGGYLSGWMYTDEGYSPTCRVPAVGANYYPLTSDGTAIDWFYTIDYFNHAFTPDPPEPAPVLTGSEAADKIAARDTSQAAGQSFHADPIDTATGAHVLERSLLAQQGAMTFDLELSYNSLLLNEGPLGKGWSHNYEARLEELSGGSLVLHWNANRKNTFSYAGNNQYYSTDSATRYDQITKQPDGSYILLRKDQSRYLFNPAGKLTAIQNGRGQQLNLAYGTGGKLASVTEPLSGMVLSFTYNADGRLEIVTDSLGRQAGFSYNAGHSLTGVTDPANQAVTYTYTSKGRVLTAIDADNIRLFHNIYDVYGRVVAQDDAVGGNEVTTFQYEETYPGIITTVTDRNGSQRVLAHDGKYQLLEVTDELGHSTAYTYDQNGNKLSETNAKGLTTTYTYDGRGNLLTVTDPEDNVTTMTYDTNNNLLTVSDPEDNVTAMTYDGNNNPLTVSDPLQNTTVYTYQNGLVKTKTSPGQGMITYTYQNGLLQNTVNEEGYSLTYTYDAAGRVTGITDGAGKITSFTYDDNDNLLSQTNPLNHSVSATYDCRGNKLSATDANGNSTAYTYNGNGKLISTVDALANETSYEYDGEDRLTGTTDARGNTTTRTLDAKGRTTGITDALDNTTTLEYDELDNLTVTKDAYGREILTTTYDNLNNPVTETDALDQTTTNAYDSLNRLISRTDPLQRLTEYAYDDLGRLSTVTDPLSGESSQGFDADGNRTTLVDPNNNSLTYTYDLLGRVTSRTSGAGRTIAYEYDSLRNLLASLTNGRDQEITYQYDDAGRLVSYTGPEGSGSYTYDGNGNILSKTDAAGTVSYEYDELNRVTEYTDVYNNVIQYEYDEVGNLLTLIYPDDKIVHYEYDANNRLSEVTDWAERVTVYTYDNNGHLETTTRPDGSVETRTYDEAGQLTQIKDCKADQTVINQFDYTYDAAGNLTEEIRTDATGTVTYEYDELNRVSEYTDTTGRSLDYSYDAAGNITSETRLQPSGATAMTYGADNRLATYNSQAVSYDADGNLTNGPLGGSMVTYQYDSRNRLSAAGNTEYTYDANNNRIEVDNDGDITRYVVNPNASLSQILMETDENGVVQSYYIYGLGLIGKEDAATDDYYNYHFDSRGSTVALSSETGVVTDRYNYGPYGEIIQQSGTTENIFLYVGQYGVVTDANGLYQMRARYYNPEIKCFINEDDLVGSVENSQSLNRYAYANGNPILYVDPLGHAPEGTGKTFRIASTTYAPRIGLPSLGEVAAGAAGAASKALGIFGGVILDILINATPTSDEDWDPDCEETSFKNNLRDIQENPSNWEKTNESTIDSTKKGNAGGKSIEEEYTNKETGDKIYKHKLTDSTGRIIDKHYRPYSKQ